jgi:hypothetical protein
MHLTCNAAVYIHEVRCYACLTEATVTMQRQLKLEGELRELKIQVLLTSMLSRLPVFISSMHITSSLSSFMVVESESVNSVLKHDTTMTAVSISMLYSSPMKENSDRTRCFCEKWL